MSAREKTELKNMLKGYKKVNSSMLKTLEKLGLAAEFNGKHYKLTRTDGKGGFITLAKTPSDGRAGLNVSKYIIDLIEMA